MEETSHKLNFATILSFNPNEEDLDDVLQDKNLDTSSLEQTSRNFLDSTIEIIVAYRAAVNSFHHLHSYNSILFRSINMTYQIMYNYYIFLF